MTGGREKDLCELRRHTYESSVDRSTVKKLVRQVFKPCRCSEIYSKGGMKETTSEEGTGRGQSVCGGHERALSIQDTVQSLDLREESIATLLCYLELHPDRWVENQNHVYGSCSIRCYGGARQLQTLAKKCPPVAVAIAKQKLDGKQFSVSSQLDFKVIDVCDSMGWDSGTVKRELKSLMWESGPDGFRKTGVLVELSDLSFHFRSRGDLTSQEMDDVLDFLAQRTQHQERAELRQLEMLSSALRSVSHKNYWMCSEEPDLERSDKLKRQLEEFFDRDDRDYGQDETEPQLDPSSLNQLTSDLRHFISLYGQEHTLTGRAIARIFHGIGSPCFPAETWGRVRRFWRCHLDLDFKAIIREATRMLVSLR
ncbi:ATP-dependent DNA helicase Q4-like [Physella acuta]|uniref:ATP-dependent DNA helicase Q4-like n=1 Tax=Physella acuta TaxID=109671 RepID=UPI0027DAFEB4|nr:ATP-dependent DNA helicase Q4-like [Physella acuta]